MFDESTLQNIKGKNHKNFFFFVHLAVHVLFQCSKVCMWFSSHSTFLSPLFIMFYAVFTANSQHNHMLDKATWKEMSHRQWKRARNERENGTSKCWVSLTGQLVLIMLSFDGRRFNDDAWYKKDHF